MDKKLAGLLGAAAALTTMTAAKAAPAVGPELPQVSTYRDLLDPIPNALPLLKADDQRLAQNGGTRTAQVVIVMSASGPEPIVIIIITIATTIIIACTDEATKGIPSDALFARRCRLPNASARELWYAAKFVDARLRDRLFLLERVKKRGAAKPDFSPRRPSRPKPSPTPSRTTTNPDGMFHKLRSRLQLRPTWPKPF